MSTLFLIISLLIVLTGIAIPFLLLLLSIHMNLGERAVFYFFFGIILMTSVSILFAWWGDKSDMLLLEHYGYNYYAMNDEERYGNVNAENMEEVKQLETSTMGVGWPIGAFFTIIPALVYLIVIFAARDSITLINIRKKRITE